MSRIWQMRRVVITKEAISFAFVGEEAQIDHIPFAEILHIKEMTDAASEEHDDFESKKFSHAMQIATLSLAPGPVTVTRQTDSTTVRVPVTAALDRHCHRPTATVAVGWSRRPAAAGYVPVAGASGVRQKLDLSYLMSN